MSTIEKNKQYIDNDCNIIFITNIKNGCIYFRSNTKKSGLINRKGLYFLENSEYHKQLKQIKK